LPKKSQKFNSVSHSNYKIPKKIRKMIKERKKGRKKGRKSFDFKMVNGIFPVLIRIPKKLPCSCRDFSSEIPTKWLTKR
jgi:hypothetical protein